MHESSFLIGRGRIQDYLGISKRTFFALVADGAPIAKRVVGGREYWVSDKDFLGEYSKALVAGIDTAPGVVFSRWLSTFGDAEPGCDRSLVYNLN